MTERPTLEELIKRILHNNTSAQIQEMANAAQSHAEHVNPREFIENAVQDLPLLSLPETISAYCKKEGIALPVETGYALSKISKSEKNRAVGITFQKYEQLKEFYRDFFHRFCKNLNAEFPSELKGASLAQYQRAYHEVIPAIDVVLQKALAQYGEHVLGELLLQNGEMAKKDIQSRKTLDESRAEQYPEFRKYDPKNMNKKDLARKLKWRYIEEGAEVPKDLDSQSRSQLIAQYRNAYYDIEKEKIAGFIDCCYALLSLPSNPEIGYLAAAELRDFRNSMFEHPMKYSRQKRKA